MHRILSLESQRRCDDQGKGVTCKRRYLPLSRTPRVDWAGRVDAAHPAHRYGHERLHLAMPSLSADLQPGDAQLWWITDSYGFMIAGSLLTLGTALGLAVRGSLGTAVYRSQVKPI